MKTINYFDTPEQRRQYGNGAIDFINRIVTYKKAKEESCEYCKGEGWVSVDEDDGEGHIARGTGRERCICKIDEPEDFSGATEGDR